MIHISLILYKNFDSSGNAVRTLNYLIGTHCSVSIKRNNMSHYYFQEQRNSLILL